MCRHETTIPVETIAAADGPTLAPIVEVVGRRCVECGEMRGDWAEVWRVSWAVKSPQGHGMVPTREDYDTEDEALARKTDLEGRVGEVVVYPVVLETNERGVA